MMRSRHRSSMILISLSLALTFALALMPLPEILRLLRPNLVMLATMYWLIRLPESVGVGGACLLGLIYDGVIGSPLGLHALSFTLGAAILLLLYARWRMFALLQQAAWIFALLMLDQAVMVWGQGGFRRTELHAWVWVSAFLGAMCWLLLSRSGLSRG